LELWRCAAQSAEKCGTKIFAKVPLIDFGFWMVALPVRG
jgi:hypothetical protein